MPEKSRNRRVDFGPESFRESSNSDRRRRRDDNYAATNGDYSDSRHGHDSHCSSPQPMRDRSNAVHHQYGDNHMNLNQTHFLNGSYGPAYLPSVAVESSVSSLRAALEDARSALKEENSKNEILQQKNEKLTQDRIEFLEGAVADERKQREDQGWREKERETNWMARENKWMEMVKVGFEKSERMDRARGENEISDKNSKITILKEEMIEMKSKMQHLEMSLGFAKQENQISGLVGKVEEKVVEGAKGRNFTERMEEANKINCAMNNCRHVSEGVVSSERELILELEKGKREMLDDIHRLKETEASRVREINLLKEKENLLIDALKKIAVSCKSQLQEDEVGTSAISPADTAVGALSTIALVSPVDSSTEDSDAVAAQGQKVQKPRSTEPGPARCVASESNQDASSSSLVNGDSKSTNAEGESATNVTAESTTTEPAVAGTATKDAYSTDWVATTKVSAGTPFAESGFEPILFVEETDGSEKKEFNVNSVTAEPGYQRKTFEQLRLEDYSLGRYSPNQGQLFGNTCLSAGGTNILPGWSNMDAGPARARSAAEYCATNNMQPGDLHTLNAVVCQMDTAMSLPYCDYSKSTLPFPVSATKRCPILTESELLNLMKQLPDTSQAEVQRLVDYSRSLRHDPVGHFQLYNRTVIREALNQNLPVPGVFSQGDRDSMINFIADESRRCLATIWERREREKKVAEAAKNQHGGSSSNTNNDNTNNTNSSTGGLFGGGLFGGGLFGGGKSRANTAIASNPNAKKAEADQSGKKSSAADEGKKMNADVLFQSSEGDNSASRINATDDSKPVPYLLHSEKCALYKKLPAAAKETVTEALRLAKIKKPADGQYQTNVQTNILVREALLLEIPVTKLDPADKDAVLRWIGNANLDLKIGVECGKADAETRKRDEKLADGEEQECYDDQNNEVSDEGFNAGLDLGDDENAEENENEAKADSDGKPVKGEEKKSKKKRKTEKETAATTCTKDALPYSDLLKGGDAGDKNSRKENHENETDKHTEGNQKNDKEGAKENQEETETGADKGKQEENGAGGKGEKSDKKDTNDEEKEKKEGDQKADEVGEKIEDEAKADKEDDEEDDDDEHFWGGESDGGELD